MQFFEAIGGNFNIIIQSAFSKMWVLALPDYRGYTYGPPGFIYQCVVCHEFNISHDLGKLVYRVHPQLIIMKYFHCLDPKQKHYQSKLQFASTQNAYTKTNWREWSDDYKSHPHCIIDLITSTYHKLEST